ncbi:MAG: DNA-3-methyladenine glycosylase [Candidatus Marinimicrobia bacterium]|nr:DNA-3-methyladenine glycosylase [Candidatus Neomarinimicrobiota bacterium]
MKKLSVDFYLRDDVLQISRELLGKVICTHINGKFTSGTVVETEAYAGVTDRASHAYNNRRTPRTETMFAEGGTAYVYLCYGVHHLFNIVTNVVGVPHAVLIRAVEPINGIDIMLHRRNMVKAHPRLTAGPGCLTQALGIHASDSGSSLLGDTIWIEDGKSIPDKLIKTSPRVGVDYAGEDAKLPWRYYIENNLWVSRVSKKKS